LYITSFSGVTSWISSSGGDKTQWLLSIFNV
jgi:hypothetical protein